MISNILEPSFASTCPSLPQDGNEVNSTRAHVIHLASLLKDGLQFAFEFAESHLTCYGWATAAVLV